jgi:hypothetical protein
MDFNRYVTEIARNRQSNALHEFHEAVDDAMVRLTRRFWPDYSETYRDMPEDEKPKDAPTTFADYVMTDAVDKKYGCCIADFRERFAPASEVVETIEDAQNLAQLWRQPETIGRLWLEYQEAAWKAWEKSQPPSAWSHELSRGGIDG